MRKRSVLKVVGAVAAALVLVCAGALAWLKFAPRQVPDGQPPLETVGADSLPAFRSAFNAAETEVRVVALLSPT